MSEYVYTNVSGNDIVLHVELAAEAVGFLSGSRISNFAPVSRIAASILTSSKLIDLNWLNGKHVRKRLKKYKDYIDGKVGSGKSIKRANKYHVSYQQARTWTPREKGLEDHRGHHKYQAPRTEPEKAQIQIEQLKASAVFSRNGVLPAKKVGRGGEERDLLQVRQVHI